MKANKKFSSLALAAITVMIVMMLILGPHQLSAAPKADRNAASAPQWSVQVDKVDPVDVALATSFQIAIYENLVDEMAKTKRFKQVFRSGDRDASSVPNLLILKTTVQKYTEGSEKKRAVTTVSGATKLNVKSQLCTRDGKVILEKVVDGNVRFFGGNLRATLNLARNVAKEIKESTLPDPSASTSTSPSNLDQKSNAVRVATAEQPAVH
jgi:hypothetical protein